MADDRWRVIHGDCLDVMKTLEPGSVDAVVTDPPYGLRFMGKDWDHGVPGKHFWSAALDAAKPGAYLAAFGGTRTEHRLVCAIEDAGWEIRDKVMWLYGSGFPKSHNGAWGGTALKPAWEPIVLARKPLEGTVAANVAAHGTGALNIDGCRIGTEVVESSGAVSDRWREAEGRSDRQPARPSVNVGRWPANLVLDEEAAAMLDEQSGPAGQQGDLTGNEPSTPAKNAYGRMGRHAFVKRGDHGGASRFFYCAKASRTEREAGLDETEASRLANDAAGDPVSDRFTTAARNHHPTVKPITLMRWLCRLVAPSGGLVLDPFAGSGSTGCAALREGFRFAGIEREAQYVEIARRRIGAAAAQGNLFAGEAR